MTTLIEDYGLIGDTHTAALVAKDGSIDWLCLPRFDSPACFAKLLGDSSNGYWKISPSQKVIETKRSYRKDTLILETEFETETGKVVLIDAMPIREDFPQVIRIVKGISGSVEMTMELVIRFDYGSIVPWVVRRDRMLQAVAGPDALSLWSTVHTHGKDLTTVSNFTVTAGQSIPFQLIHHPSHEPAPRPLDATYIIDETETYWKSWAAISTYDGEYKDQVVRSLLTLKALTYHPTGGIVAAPTTSLPEAIGGERNWDYRYCWLRDASLSLDALVRGGYIDEASAWRDWLVRAVAGDPSKLQIMYGASGERRLEEYVVPWLKGYEDSAPVRVGNNAVGQFQLDVYGEVMAALHDARIAGLSDSQAAWDLQLTLIDYVESRFGEPDEGIWEVRGPRRHFTHSKVMAWVALDRAVEAVVKNDLPGPVDKWRQSRDLIHKEVLEKAWNPDKKAFTQYYGSDTLDASVLMIPIMGFLPANDSRVVATVEAIEKELVVDGFVLRYQVDDKGSVDGLTGREGAFLACSFWLADTYAMMGRQEDAVKLFERLLSVTNDLDLLAEEYDSILGRQVGNFPQAFSHISLINTACNLSHMKKGFEVSTFSRSVDKPFAARLARRDPRKRLWIHDKSHNGKHGIKK